MKLLKTGSKGLMAVSLATLLTACVAGADNKIDYKNSSESFLARSPLGWERRSGNKEWTIDALEAVTEKDALLAKRVPADINQWCPAYKTASIEQRRAFWVGLMHAVAKHESTWNAKAVGGGGRYHGLMQISPATARAYGCDAKSGAALKDGGENLACAVQIFSRNVARDGLVAGNGTRGIGRDWGPFRKSKKRAEMAAVTSAQPWCKG